VRVLSPRVRLATFCIMVSIAVPLGTALGAGPEERCSELGSRCVCSEPLDNNDFSGGWTTPSSAVWDPSDSPNATECGYGSPSDGNLEIDPAAGHYQTRPATDVPSGERFNVFATYGGGITSLFFTGNKLCDSNPARACVRWYRRWAPGFPSVTTCGQEAKWFEAYTGVSGGIQGTSGSDIFSLRHITPFGDADVPKDRTMGPPDCRDQWCRFEVCMTGHFCDSGVQTIEAWVTGIDTGEEVHFGPNSQNTSGDSFQHPFVNLWTTCSANSNQWTEVSHMMAAGWSNNGGQRIGAAYEMEGSGGGQSTPPAEPPAALPPAAPHLLEE
jgi:hypothetical protein